MSLGFITRRSACCPNITRSCDCHAGGPCPGAGLARNGRSIWRRIGSGLLEKLSNVMLSGTMPRKIFDRFLPEFGAYSCSGCPYKKANSLQHRFHLSQIARTVFAASNFFNARDVVIGNLRFST